MANPEHLAILREGVKAWNAWRQASDEVPDLSEAILLEPILSDADLSGADIEGALLPGAHFGRSNLSGANFSGADLLGASFSFANLTGASFRRANLANANFYAVDLTGATLEQADLSGARLGETKLMRADLTGANLSGASLVDVVADGASIRGCRVFGASVWRSDLAGAIQENLVITDIREPAITVDNLEVAQFIYLLLHNQKIRQVIDTITSKVVLILGSFGPVRKALLDRLREELREHGFLPVLFDFEGPESRDITETVSTLAHLARFVIADLTDPRSIPQELQKIVPQLPSLPIQPIMFADQDPWAMFPHFERYPWVLPPYRYESAEHLCEALAEHVIAPAVRKAEELRAPQSATP